MDILDFNCICDFVFTRRFINRLRMFIREIRVKDMRNYGSGQLWHMRFPLDAISTEASHATLALHIYNCKK